jgi:NADH-quinone oxidoreductase subunit L
VATFSDPDFTHYEAALAWSPLGGGFVFELGLLVDGLTAVMLLLVTTVSLMVHVYSKEYMQGEPRFTYFFSMLSLFTFSMLVLVVANNTLQAVIGWELVGLCSFLLIGFYWEEKPNQDAANKAFLTTKFGDVGLIVGCHRAVVRHVRPHRHPLQHHPDQRGGRRRRPVHRARSCWACC